MKRKKVVVSLSIFLSIVLIASLLCALVVPLMPEKIEPDNVEFEFFASDLANEKQLYPESHDSESHNSRNYYIAADGGRDVDGADGTIEKPYSIDFFRWLSRNSEEGTVVFGPGDQILLKRGDVFDKNLELNYLKGAADNPITISSYGDSTQRPIIEIGNKNYGQSTKNTGSVAAVIVYRCSNIVVRDLEINVKWTSRQTAISSGAGGISVEYDKVGNNKYENVYIVNNIIHSQCIEEGKNPCEANTYGIRINSYEASYDTTPNDFVVDGVYVTNNEIYNVGRSGIIAHGWLEKEKMVQMKYTCLKNVHLDNNVVHDVGTIGIYAGAATGCTMNRNLVYNTGMYVCDLEKNEDPQEGEGGLMSMCLKDAEIKYNVTYNNHRQGILNDGIGIDIDWNSINIVVQYNYVYGCDGSGIGTMANYNCKILNNKVFDNLIATNQPGQISVCDYVPWGDAGALAREYIEKNSPNALTVRNLEIAENFISGAPQNGEGVNPDFPNKSLFYARRGNGVGDWIGNSFHNNHVVYSGNDGNFFFNLITNESNNLQDTVSWDKFYNNQYFAKKLSLFACLDETVYNRLDGATLVPVCTSFESWSKRDLGSTFEKYTPNSKPGKPSKAKVEFKNGNLSFSWNKSSGDIWHYNIYKIKQGEEISYRNLLEQTKTTSFNFAPDEKGTFYIVIEPENNMGVVGEALRLKISLK